MWQLLEILNVFNTLTLKQIFWKTQTLFKKLEFRFLVESTKVDNATFPCKIALSKTNFNSNRIGSTKWTYHKEWRFVTHKELIWCTNHPHVHIHIFRRRCSFIWGCSFMLLLHSCFLIKPVLLVNLVFNIWMGPFIYWFIN